MNQPLKHAVSENTEAGATPVLSLKDVTVSFGSDDKPLHAIEDVSFDILPGETLALVGESGCGKSVTALAIMGLLPKPGARLTRGKIAFDGVELTTLGESTYQEYRGNRMAMIFQEPMTTLNPVMTVGDQVSEVLHRHTSLGRNAIRERVIDLIRQVGIADPERRVRQFPHEFSGGMCQRVVIAMSLACNPSLLIGDEPTTALDVTVQAQILDLIDQLQKNTGTSVLLITHDLGVVAEQADRAVVMYAGRVVEVATVSDILTNPRHPYTRGLINSIPQRKKNRRGTGQRLGVISGAVPGLGMRGSGCAFAGRCDRALAKCCSERPRLTNTSPTHQFACFNPMHEDVTK